MSRFAHLLPVALIVTAAGSAALAQNLQQRIDEVRRERQSEQRAEGQRRSPSLGQRLGGLRDVPATQAFQWLEAQADLKIVIDWQRLRSAGVDPSQAVRIPGGIPVSRALDLLVRQIDPGDRILWEPTPWYVRVLTKQQANREAVVRTYPVGDLLAEAPTFDQAPAFDLDEVTRSASGGGGRGSGGGGGGQGLFEDNQRDRQQGTEADRRQRIAALIRNTVEPDIWRANGGTHGSITFFGDTMVVRAPKYVHRQIGGEPASRTGGAARPGGTGRAEQQPAAQQGARPSPNRPRQRRSADDNTAGVRQPLRYSTD